MDPALWAELEGPRDHIVAAIVRFVPGAPPPANVRIIARFGDIATIRVRRGELLALHAHPSVASLKAPRPMVPDQPIGSRIGGGASSVATMPGSLWRTYRDGTREPRRQRSQRPGQRSLGTGQPSGRGVVVGLVDWGCDFKHVNFIARNGRTRLRALWDQRGSGRGSPSYGYGVVHNRRAIDRALASDDPFAELGYDPIDADDDDNGTHGTHVMDIAAGVPNAGPGGVAPGAEIVFVHLAALSWGPRHIASSVCLLEAVDFISRVAGAKPWVINLSLGSHAGPHDGTTLVEQALDALVTSGPGRVIVQSCGNYGKRPVHTAGRLAPGRRRRLRWHVDPSDQTPNEIELWYPGRDSIAMNLIAPDGRTVARALPDSHGTIVDGTQQIGRFAHRRGDPNNGDNQATIILDPERARRGPWQVELEALTIADGHYHVWIERDEVTRGSQSRLARADFVPTTTTGTICNGQHTISVGAYDPQTRARAWFSSIGPTRDGRNKPDILAKGVGIVAARSDGSDDDQALVTTKSGTSMASPHVAGAVAVLLEAAQQPLTAGEVKQILIETGTPSGDGPPLLNLRAAVARVRGSSARREARAELTEAVPATTACCEDCAPPNFHPQPLPAEPAEVFDAFLRGTSLSEAARHLRLVAMPGEHSILPVRDTDIVVRRALGEGRIATVGRIAELRETARSSFVPGYRAPFDTLVLREGGAGGAPPGPCDSDSRPCAPNSTPTDPPKPKRTVDEWLALDTPPSTDDAAAARGIELATAKAKNLHWWTEFGLDRVKPLRGVDPTEFPIAYANRTLKVQQFLTAQAIDVKVLHRRIVPDGILGADTLTLLHHVAWYIDLGFFRTDLVALGVAVERLGAIGGKAAHKARITALPLEITYEWDATSTADKVLNLYRRKHTDTAEKRLALQTWLLGDLAKTSWPPFDWDTYIGLMRRLYGSAPIRVRGGFLRGYRRAEDEDAAIVAKRDSAALAFYIWQRDPTTEDREQLGVDIPQTTSGRKAVAEWSQSDGDPNVDMVILKYLPKITEDTRRATVNEWLLELEAAERKRKEQNKESLHILAVNLVSRLDQTRSFIWEFHFADEAGPLVAYPPDVRTTFFDELTALGKLDAFYDAFADMVNFDNRAVAANLTKDTKYEKTAAYLKYLAAHRKKTEGIRKHAYDVEKQQIILDKNSDRVLRIGQQWSGVAGDVHPIYKRDQKIERLKPARQRELCKQTLKELTQLIAEAAATAKDGRDGTTTDSEKLLETAVNRARDALVPPLSKDDVETISWEMSVRVTGLARRPIDGIERVQIEYEIVERINGGHWIPVPCSKRWRSEQEFGEELFFIFWEHFTRVMNWIAAVTIAVVAIAFLAMSGIGVALIRLAGGVRFVLANVLISEAIYVITSGGELSWEGFLQAALAGYLQALGFRAFAPVGNWLGGLVAGKATGLMFLRAGASWLVTKGVTGGGAFALQEVGTLFAMDMIVVLRGGSMSSWKDYVKTAGHGFLLGAALEIGLGTAITGLGGALRGTVAHKLASALGRALSETKQVLKGMSADAFIDLCIKAKLGFDDFVFGASQGLSRFKAWLRDVVEDPALIAQVAGDVSKQIEASAAALAKKLKATPGAAWTGAKAASKRAWSNIATSFYADIIALSDVVLSDRAIFGLRRMLAEHGGALKPSDLTTAMQKLRLAPKSADGALALLGALDKEILEIVLKRDALYAFIESKGLLSLISRGVEMTVADLRTLFQRGFAGKLNEFDAWVAELDKLAADAQASVLAAMRTHIDSLSPAAAIALVKQGIALDAVRLAGVEAMAAGSSRTAMDALIARAPKGLDEVLQHAGTTRADAPALASLTREPDLVAGLIDSTMSASELARVLEASGRNPRFVDDLFRAIQPRPSRAALILEDLEHQGLERILRVAQGDQAAAKRLLETPERSRAFLRDAARATDDQAVRSAIRRGHFDPWATPKPMRAEFRGENTGSAPISPAFQTQYFGAAERATLRVSVRNGKLWHPDGRPVDTSNMRTFFSGSGRAIYVMDLHGDIFLSQQQLHKVHHSSILAGEPVGCAGEIQVNNGTVTFVSNKSGHYWPTGAQFDAFLQELENRGVVLPDRADPTKVRKY